MWQKEAMINAAVNMLPSHVRYVTWIDHDMMLHNANWLSESVAMLDNGSPAVQLLDRIHYQRSDGVVDRSLPSGVAGEGGNPGGAWITTRDLFKWVDGLTPFHITGGGDQPWYYALTGKSKPKWTQRLPNKLETHTKRHMADIMNAIDGKRATFVAGDAVHLYHGDKKHRQYRSRIELLVRADYDPTTDVVVDANGLLRWDSDKPTLHREVMQFFTNRKEDG